MFIEDGFVRIDDVFSRTAAAAARELLWRDSGCDPEDRATWTKPVVRLGEYAQAPFVEALRSPRLRAAIDQLVGPGRWLPRASVGTFVVRFPSLVEPGDDGWHVDVSFPPSDPAAGANFFSWRANVASRGRALLMLMLFSDAGERDGPTRLRRGSHADVARVLAGEGDEGLAFMELAKRAEEASAARPTAYAAGSAGTVYLCHPFLVHAGNACRGDRARFLAQPGISMKGQLAMQSEGAFPVEQAILRALGR